MDGHTGLSNTKVGEATNGEFFGALSSLKATQHQSFFVMHVYSNTFDFSPYLQRSNVRFLQRYQGHYSACEERSFPSRRISRRGGLGSVSGESSYRNQDSNTNERPKRQVCHCCSEVQGQTRSEF